MNLKSERVLRKKQRGSSGKRDDGSEYGDTMEVGASSDRITNKVCFLQYTFT